MSDSEPTNNTVKQDPRDLERICLMSAISGTLMRDGEPIRHARVKQSVSRVYGDGFVEKETQTDENGYFAFPVIFEDKQKFVLLPIFRNGQVLTVIEKEQETDFWIGVKTDGLENSEARGKRLKVTCDLTETQNRTYIDKSNYISFCHWDVVSDPEPEPY